MIFDLPVTFLCSWKIFFEIFKIFLKILSEIGVLF